MRIGIDASRAALARRTGTEAYSLHLIRSLLASDGARHNDYILYFNSPAAPDLFPTAEHVTRRAMPFPRLWTHARLSWEMARRPPDVLFVPAHVLPLIHPRRTGVTIHDLGYYHEPEAHPARQRAYLQWSTVFNATAATLVIADSQATRCDLIDILRVPERKIRVVYLGVDDRFRPPAAPEQTAPVAGRYGIDGPYILYVGTLQPRKNLVRLLQAFKRLVQALQDGYEGMGLDAADPLRSIRLVLAGAKGWGYEEIFTAVTDLELAERVVFPGYVADDDLPALYSGARLFVLPSLYEGFGLPALEAMACGTPVVASRVSSLPEVVGEAGLLVDPQDDGDIARAMIRVLLDEERAQTLRSAGLQRARLFTWERCARETLAVLEEAGARQKGTGR